MTSERVLAILGPQPHPETQTQLLKPLKGFCKGFPEIPNPNISIAGPLYMAAGHSDPKYTASHGLALQRCVLAPGTSYGCRHQRDAHCSLDK